MSWRSGQSKKGKRNMKKQTGYRRAPRAIGEAIEEVEIIEDFLPNPSEVISMAEIQARFESEWVLLEDPESDESLEVKSGKLLWHSNDRDEVYRKAIELRPKHSAILYTGKLPEGMEIIL